VKNVVFAAASTVALLAAGPASAAEVVYTFAGTFSGTASGQDFVGQNVVFNAVGDTATARIDATTGFRLVDLTSVTASMGGIVVFTLGEPTVFGINQGRNSAGILDRAITKQYFGFNAPALNSYDGTTSFDEISLSSTGGTVGGTFASSSGASTITAISNLRFSAAPAVAAVPEPATWAMMLVGFGLVATTARYRRRGVKLTYA
jgi:hypothetical protein